jgi:hypothetical protein
MRNSMKVPRISRIAYVHLHGPNVWFRLRSALGFHQWRVCPFAWSELKRAPPVLTSVTGARSLPQVLRRRWSEGKSLVWYVGLKSIMRRW